MSGTQRRSTTGLGHGTPKATPALLAAASAPPAAVIAALAENALARGTLLSFSHILALHLVLLLPLVFAEVSLGLMLPRDFSLRGSLRRFWNLFGGPRGAARLYALGTLLVGAQVATSALLSWFQSSFHHTGLISLSFSLLLLAELALWALLYLPLVSVWSLILRVVGQPSLHTALLVLCAFFGGLVAWGVRGGLLGEGWDLRPPLLLLLLLLAQLALSSLLSVGNRRLALLVLGLGLVVGAIFVPRSVLRLAHEPAADAVLVQRTALARWTLAHARTLLDTDGDGYAAALGGGDCDDTDPLRHPGGLDLSGDGVDSDCDGFDGVGPAPEGGAAPPPGAPAAATR